MQRAAEPTLFEFAGGGPALLALARAHHARCVADPELNHPFSHDDLNPEHVERLAAYWGEVLGGPPEFSERCGDHAGVVRMHSGEGEMGDLGERFHRCFVAAMDDAGLPADAAFRKAMSDYMRAAVEEMVAHPDGPDDVAPDEPMPHWGWHGRIA